MADWMPSFGGGLGVLEPVGISEESSFAKNQLLKYGWQKGDGLGKKRDGISKPISVGLKFDNKGLGKDSDEWSYAWWDHAYNKSSACLTVTKTETGEVSISGKVGAEESMVKKQILYGSFVSSKETIAEKDYSMKVSDAELLAACEGRTARKGARADVQTGKLKRTGYVELLRHVAPDNDNVNEDKKRRRDDCENNESARKSDLDFSEIEGGKKKRKKSKSEKEKREPEKMGNNVTAEIAEDNIEKRKKKKKEQAADENVKIESGDKKSKGRTENITTAIDENQEKSDLKKKKKKEVET